MAAAPKIKDLQYEIERLKKELVDARTSRPYGLVWEDKPEQFEKDAENALPVLVEKGGKFKDVVLEPEEDYNVLIEGDNYHSLSVLSYTHKGKFDVIYADPPYNTGNSSWRYNNDYVEKDDIFRHSKWLSFMYKRIDLAKDLLKDDGIFVLTIDDYELFAAGLLLDRVFGEENRIGVIAIETNPRGRTTNTFFATSHEYILVYAKRAEEATIDFKDLTEEQMGAFDLEDEISKYRLLPFRRSGGLSTREERPNSFYPIYFDAKSNKISIENFKGAVEILPIDSEGRERVWRQTRPSLLAAIRRGDMVIKSNGTKYTVLMKDRIKEGRKAKTVWIDPKYDASSHGTVLIQTILGKRKVFDYPKSLYAVLDTLGVLIKSKKDAKVLDFFAGSGTTAQAVLQMNDDDGGDRSFVLCTNNENKICEEVTYERIRAVMSGYKGKRDERVAGLGGNLKYLKTDFVPRHVEYGLTDEARMDLTRQANLLLALKENTFTKEDLTDSYEIFSSTTHLTGVYFTEDKRDLDAMLKALKKRAKGKVVNVYIFSWEKGAYKAGFEEYPEFHFEDIPEPILDVYRSIGY